MHDFPGHASFPRVCVSVTASLAQSATTLRYVRITKPVCRAKLIVGRGRRGIDRSAGRGRRPLGARPRGVSQSSRLFSHHKVGKIPRGERDEVDGCQGERSETVEQDGERRLGEVEGEGPSSPACIASPAILSTRQSSESRSSVAQQPASCLLAATTRCQTSSHTHSQTALLERLGHFIALLDVAVRCPALPLLPTSLRSEGNISPRPASRHHSSQFLLARTNQLK
ncbi:hypothetical protein BJY59DRAFT_444610 [Rhodotorula toruloides]